MGLGAGLDCDLDVQPVAGADVPGAGLVVVGLPPRTVAQLGTAVQRRPDPRRCRGAPHARRAPALDVALGSRPFFGQGPEYRFAAHQCKARDGRHHARLSRDLSSPEALPHPRRRFLRVDGSPRVDPPAVAHRHGGRYSLRVRGCPGAGAHPRPGA